MGEFPRREGPVQGGLGGVGYLKREGIAGGNEQFIDLLGSLCQLVLDKLSDIVVAPFF